jgi:enoyl-CoA hydratase/carnithine racemase
LRHEGILYRSCAAAKRISLDGAVRRFSAVMSVSPSEWREKVINSASSESVKAVVRRHTEAQFDLPSSLSVDFYDDIAVLRLSRPEKRNAIDLAMIRGIDRFFSELPAGIRAVIICGNGAHFSAGADLSSITDANGSSALSASRACHRLFDRIEYGDVPVIAVLHGFVVGAGLELAAAAHIRVAERGTFFALPEGSRGIFVGGGGSVRVPRLIGVARMMDMMLTGRTYDAEEGVALGLAQYLAEPDQGLATGLELAKRMIANAPLANFAIIQALPRVARADPETGLLLESLMFSVAAADDEAKTRLRAFIDKRAQKVSHR